MTAPTATTVVAGAPTPSPPLPSPPSPLQPGESQAFSVGFEFETDATFDEVGAEVEIAAQLAGVSDADVTITVTETPEGTQKVTVSIYAADAAKAQSVAASLNAPPFNNADALSLGPLLGIATVTPGSIKEAAVQVTTNPAPSPPSPSPPPAVIAIASSPPPSPSPAPPPPPSLPDGLVAVATHKSNPKPEPEPEPYPDPNPHPHPNPHPNPYPNPNPNPYPNPNPNQVATHKFTLTAKDTATRRRRLAQITTVS